MIAYDQILNRYMEENAVVWADLTYIELIKILKESEGNSDFSEKFNLVRNLIILILSLIGDKPPDNFNKRGKDVKELSKEDFCEMKDLLLTEFF